MNFQSQKDFRGRVFPLHCFASVSMARLPCEGRGRDRAGVRTKVSPGFVRTPPSKSIFPCRHANLRSPMRTGQKVTLKERRCEFPTLREVAGVAAGRIPIERAYRPVSRGHHGWFRR